MPAHVDQSVVEIAVQYIDCINIVISTSQYHLFHFVKQTL